MSRRTPGVLAALLLAAPVLGAQDEITLKVGDKAPPLTVARWVKGSPVPAFVGGTAYVIEFWATWCGPCISGMPHLSELQREYEGKLTIIGVTSVDSRRKKPNTLEAVEKMVADKGDVMGYTVAWDTERKTNEAYMRAAGQNGIPCSFLVDKTGTIAYIGHPYWLDLPLARVIEGTWDPVKGMAELEQVQDELMDIEFLAKIDTKKALAAANRFAREHKAVAHLVADYRFDLYLRDGQYDKGFAVGAKLVEKAIHGKDARKLNQIAWKIVAPKAPWEERDLDLALRAAEKANAFTKGESADMLDTLARVHYLLGHIEQAIDLQRKAVELAAGPIKEGLQKILASYEKDFE
ncbi:MAG: redoxin domain-containing protein [Planctomycetota bacterium]|nr:redoxin domain-containing protein [Planctomycetota bacterium]